jgi:acyl-CoA reductase-like NAD-dependent aldehyde dehydrogenase
MNARTDRVPEAMTSFMDGAFVSSDSAALVDVVNPSTGQPFASIPAGCDRDADRAVRSARRAFEDGRWCNTPPSLRKLTLHRFADLIVAHARELDALDAGEMGKPVREAFGNAVAAASLARFYAEAIDKLTGDVYCSDHRSVVMQRRVPRGVVAAVAPWNFPTYNAVLKVAPALAAGNCVVLKPSELSSGSALRLADLALDAGLPAGVLNVVLGLGETVGQALGMHSGVDMIAFTGSTEVGKLMMQYAGRSNMKVVLAECGGKSPQIVFDDGVDLDAAGERIAQMLLTNQGQICSVGSRLLVQRSIEARLVEKIATRMKRIVIGDALDAATTFGPLASQRQCRRVMQYIEDAQADGAQIVTGGARALISSGGFFVEPTLLRHVAPQARVAQEEVFGPVLAVIPFDGEQQAIEIANSTIYGLTAYVWTANVATAMRVVQGIRSSVKIHATAPIGEAAGHAPSFEPSGQSGVGVEGGLAGMESYLRRQTLSFGFG